MAKLQGLTKKKKDNRSDLQGKILHISIAEQNIHILTERILRLYNAANKEAELNFKKKDFSLVYFCFSHFSFSFSYVCTGPFTIINCFPSFIRCIIDAPW